MGHRLSVVGSGVHQVRERRPVGIERLEGVVRRTVEVFDLLGSRAVGVERLAEPRLNRAALVGRQMRSGENRSRDWIVRNRQARLNALTRFPSWFAGWFKSCAQYVISHGHPADQSAKAGGIGTVPCGRRRAWLTLLQLIG